MRRGGDGTAREPQPRARRREAGEKAGGGRRPTCVLVQSRRRLPRKVGSTNAASEEQREGHVAHGSRRGMRPAPAESDARASEPPTGSDWSLPCHCQAILAFSTGAAASGAGTFVVVHSIWQHAQLQGEAADARVTELRRLQGTHLETARRQVRASACSPSGIALSMLLVGVSGSALSRSRWPCPAYSTSGCDAI